MISGQACNKTTDIIRKSPSQSLNASKPLKIRELILFHRLRLHSQWSLFNRNKKALNRLMRTLYLMRLSRQYVWWIKRNWKEQSLPRSHSLAKLIPLSVTQRKKMWRNKRVKIKRNSVDSAMPLTTLWGWLQLKTRMWIALRSRRSTGASTRRKRRSRNNLNRIAKMDIWQRRSFLNRFLTKSTNIRKLLRNLHLHRGNDSHSN